MESQQVDEKLLALLKELPYQSRLGTSLLIRLADYAAQLCGCRSTRQIDDLLSDDVEDFFNSLVDSLSDIVLDIQSYIESEHKYKESLFDLDDYDLEILLEDTLYSIIEYDSSEIFIENFFE